MTIGYLNNGIFFAWCKDMQSNLRTPRLQGFVIKKLNQNQRPKIFLLVKLPYLWFKLPYLWKTVQSYWTWRYVLLN